MDLIAMVRYVWALIVMWSLWPVCSLKHKKSQIAIGGRQFVSFRDKLQRRTQSGLIRYARGKSPVRARCVASDIVPCTTLLACRC